MAAIGPQNPTSQFGMELQDTLQLIFLDPILPFAKLTPNVALMTTCMFSKRNDSMYMFALGEFTRGDELPPKVFNKVVDVRVEADGRIAVGFAHLQRSDVELGAVPLRHEYTRHYGEETWSTYDIAMDIAKFLTFQS